VMTSFSSWPSTAKGIAASKSARGSRQNRDITRLQ
jgi:hypothetical protein